MVLVALSRSATSESSSVTSPSGVALTTRSGVVPPKAPVELAQEPLRLGGLRGIAQLELHALAAYREA